jgi:hypothetical protein
MRGTIPPLPQYVFMAWCLVKLRDNFTFFPLLVKMAVLRLYALPINYGQVYRLTEGARKFSLHHRVQNGSGAHTASYPMGTRGSFPGGKAARGPVKLTTHSQYAFMAWCSVLKKNYTGTTLPFISCGYEVHGIILLRNLKGAVRLDRGKDMSVHVSTCTSYHFRVFNPSCVQVVALIRRVFFYFSSQK